MDLLQSCIFAVYWQLAQVYLLQQKAHLDLETVCPQQCHVDVIEFFL